MVDFFAQQRHPDGGFRDRAGNSDLYYSVFGIEGSLALQQTLPADWLLSYVRSCSRNLASLDLVHLSCLARCWNAAATHSRGACPVEELVDEVLKYRGADGGYRLGHEGEASSLYGCFVAVGAFQDLGYPIPHLDSLLDFVTSLRDPRGGYYNSLDMPISLAPQTAGAVGLMRSVGRLESMERAAEWLLSCFHPQGGFCVSELMPIPDLLSTATVLHALAALKVDVDVEISELCLDFIDSLWTNRGGFYGQWEDTHADVEYTFYALLALGHLSVMPTARIRNEDSEG
ncbi:prenyltransferase/squalene oxidase repeat-containing protein [Novipirellula aureliae]|uniref:prenyltransferase/squalene oxidase repeat-containing protein n=1 Tax=Novipirellula aureliae TaxID=2527966 RepID=UPI0018CC93CB|nr:prenyltransferase/squalene oxidase repeat-containing protein [Novipirellula aureliae]